MHQRIELDERIAEKADLFAEKAGRQAEKIARKVEKKVAEAMEKFEHRGQYHKDLGGSFNPASSNWVEPAGPKENPVSDDEKNLILKMLQEKKITPEEAEKLFEALEGKSG